MDYARSRGLNHMLWDRYLAAYKNGMHAGGYRNVYVTDLSPGSLSLLEVADKQYILTITMEKNSIKYVQNNGNYKLSKEVF